MCTHVHAHVCGSHRLILDGLLYCFPPSCLSSLLLNLVLSVLAGLAGPRNHLSLSPSTVLSLQVYTACLAFYLRAQDSRPHAYSVSTLPIEPSPYSPLMRNWFPKAKDIFQKAQNSLARTLILKILRAADILLSTQKPGLICPGNKAKIF